MAAILSTSMILEPVAGSAFTNLAYAEEVSADPAGQNTPSEAKTAEAPPPQAAAAETAADTTASVQSTGADTTASVQPTTADTAAPAQTEAAESAGDSAATAETTAHSEASVTEDNSALAEAAREVLAKDAALAAETAEEQAAPEEGAASETTNVQDPALNEGSGSADTETSKATEESEAAGEEGSETLETADAAADREAGEAAGTEDDSEAGEAADTEEDSEAAEAADTEEDSETAEAADTEKDTEAAEAGDAEEESAAGDTEAADQTDAPDDADNESEENTDQLPEEEEFPGTNPEAALSPVGLSAGDLAPVGADNDDNKVENPISELQDMVNRAIEAAEALKGILQIKLKANTLYTGDVKLWAGNREKSDDFALELVADDAGENGTSGSGYTTIDGNVTIKDIKVIMKSIVVADKKQITMTGGDLEFYGMNDAMNEVTVEVGEKSSAKIIMGDDDDTVKIISRDGAKNIDVQMGDGVNIVNAAVYSGDATIKTGRSNDVVELYTDAGAGEVKVETGDDNDELTIINNGGSMEVNSGGGDDIVELDVRAGMRAGGMTLNTGTGGDIVDVYKGDHFTRETVDYEEYSSQYETFNDNSPAVISVINEDPLAMDRFEINVDVADAIRGIQFDSKKGESIYLWGALEEDVPITSEEITEGELSGRTKLILTADHRNTDMESLANTLELWVDKDKDILSDDLDNKETVSLIASGDSFEYTGELKDFTNYMFITPVSDLESIRIDAARPLLLTNIVFDPEESMDDDDTIVINDLSAKNVNVMARGKKVVFNGNVEAQNVRVDAQRGTTMYYENLDFSMEGLGVNLESFQGISTDMINFKDEARIIVNPEASIVVDNDIDLLARIKHYGSIVTAMPAWLPIYINVANVKLAAVAVDIDGTLETKRGTVSARAWVQTNVGENTIEKDDGTEVQSADGFPIAISWVSNHVEVNVGENAVIKSASDILLTAESKIKALTYADSSTIPWDKDIALAVILNEVSSVVSGSMTAERKVWVKANGNVKDTAEASRKQKDGHSGFFLGANYVDQEVKAIIAKTARVVAKNGSVEVYGRAVSDISTTAASFSNAETEQKDEDLKASIAAAVKIVHILVSGIVKHIGGSNENTGIWKKVFGSIEEKAQKILKSVADSDYSVMVITPYQANSLGTATVNTDSNGSKVTAEVTVEPFDGNRVKAVKYRYLVPGEDHYTIKTAARNDGGSYTFDVPSKNVEVYVEYEEDGGAGQNGNNGAQQNVRANNGGNENLNFNGMVNDAAVAARNAENDAEIRQAQEEDENENEEHCVLDFAKMVDGAVVTYLTDPQREGHSISRIDAGQRVLLVPNPKTGYKLETLTVSYETTNDQGKTVNKEETIEADEDGEYIFTVPENAPNGKHFEVKATFVKGEEEAPESQRSGAVVLQKVNNDLKTLIEDGSSVDAGGALYLFSFRSTKAAANADGTAVTKDDGKKKKKKNAPKMITKTKYDVSGAQYAMRVTATEGGTVECKNAGTISNHPKFIVTPQSGYKVDKVYMSYYTKLNASTITGKRQTIELTQNEDGEWVASMLSAPIEEGSTADITAIFVKENETEAKKSLPVQEAQYIVRNPINVRYNLLSKKGADGEEVEESIGYIAFDLAHSKNGVYYFTLRPSREKGYTIDPVDHDDPNINNPKSNKSVLYASYLDAAGVLRKHPLKRDEHGWYLKVTDMAVPAGGQITVNAVFSEQLHDMKQGSDTKNASVEFETEKAKTTDEVEGVVKADDGYHVGQMKVTWYDPVKIKQQEEMVTVGEDGKFKFTVPEMKDDSSLTFTPIAQKKDIVLKAVGSLDGNVSDKNIKVSAGSTGYIGQTIELKPSDKLAEQGYKVAGISLKYYDQNGRLKEIGYNQSSFKVPDDIKVMGTANLEIEATLEMKPIELRTKEEENGVIKPAVAYAEGGEKVVVKIQPKGDYKIKKGSLKAEIKMGNAVKQIVLTRTAPNQYTFTMPKGADYTTAVEFVGTFEAGNDDDSFSAGVSVALNIVGGANELSIQGNNKAKNLQMIAVNSGKATDTAKAGYSKGKTGFAGALAIQYVDTKNLNYVRKGTALTLTNGNIFMLAKGKQQLMVTADGSGKKDAEVEGTGVGAGIAFSIGSMEMKGEIEDGVKFDAEKSRLTGVNINVGQKLKDIIKAKAGASGGSSSFVPVAAVDIVAVDSKANLGRISEGMLKVPGGVKIKSGAESARTEYNHEITADASSKGGDTAIGGAFVVTYIKNSSEARLNQSLDAQSLTLKSTAGDAMKATATAAAAGGFQTKKKKSENKGADKQANNLLKAGAILGGKGGSKNLNANAIGNQAENRQMAETTESSLGVAASFVLNLQTNNSNARVEDGVDVTTTGAISVNSFNRTAAEIKADSSTTKTDKGVGVGIAINIVNGENNAYLGNGTFSGSSIEVIAGMASVPSKISKWPQVRDEGTFTIALKKLITEKMKELLEDTKIDWLAEYIGDIGGEFANEIIKDTELEKLLNIQSDGGAAGHLETAYELLKERILSVVDVFISPFDAVYEELLAVNMTDEQWEEFKEDIINMFTTQLEGNAVQEIKKLIDDNKNKLLATVLEMVESKMSGNGWDASSFGDFLADTAKEYLKGLFERMVNDTITKLSVDFPLLSENNLQYLKQTFDKGFKDMPANFVKDFADYCNRIFREYIFDYEKYLVKYAESSSLKDMVLDKVLAASKKSVRAISNRILDSLAAKFNASVEKEPKADRHVIYTSAISGAGAKERSGAGSLAVTVLNMKTTAEIASGEGRLETTIPEKPADPKAKYNAGTQKLTVNAIDVRRVRNVATAAVDARGDADMNSGAGEAEAKDSGSKADNTLAYNQITVNTGLGGKAEFNPTSSDTSPLVWLNIEDGYKLPENMKAKRSYKDAEGADREDEVDIQTDEEGQYFILPYQGLNGEDAKDRPLTVEVEFDEDLREVKAPEVVGTGIPAGAVTVGVKGREVEGGRLMARAGELVKVTTKKIDGKKVTKIGYDYTDKDGRKQEVVCDVIDSSNENETVYLIKMPNYNIDSIVVQYEDGQDTTERTMGVGAGVALVYGTSEVTASLGKRSDTATGIKAGTLDVRALSDHNEYNFSVAGSDPFKGTTDDEKDLGIDVSLAANWMKNTIAATVEAGSKITTFGTVPENYKQLKEGNTSKDQKEDEKDDPRKYVPDVIAGGLYVVAHESSSSESRSSAFATGSTTAVGGSGALNIATSTIKAAMKSGAAVSGEAYVGADSAAKDVTWSIATAFGADLQRTMNKYIDKGSIVRQSLNRLISGEIFDEYTSENRKKKKIKTADKLNEALNGKKKDGADNAENGLPTTTNVLRSQGVENGDDGGANDAADAGVNDANNAAGRNDIAAQPNKTKKSKLQVAATVGFTWADHETSATVEGDITAGMDLTALAINHGNFQTRSTAAAISLEEKPGGGSTAAAAVAVSVNNNEASVETKGSLVAQGGSVAVTSDLTLNMDDRFRGLLGAQALAGAGSGKGTDNTIGGAIAVIRSKSRTTAKAMPLRSGEKFSLKGEDGDVTVTATDKTKMALRAGGISASSGSNIGIGISAALIWSGNTVSAEVGDNVTVDAKNFVLGAVKKPVSYADYRFPIDVKDVFTATTDGDDDKKNLETGLINISKKKGEQSYTIESNIDTYHLIKLIDVLNFLSSTNYYTEAIAGSLDTGGESNALNGAGSIAVVNADNVITTVLGRKATVQTYSTIPGTGNISVTAGSGTNARMIGGAFSGGKARKAAGITITYMGDSDDVRTEIKDGASFTAVGNTTVNTSVNTDAEAYNAAAAVNTAGDADLTLGGAINIIRPDNTARTVIGKGVTLSASGRMDIASTADMNLTLISGSVAGGKDGAAAGGTVAYIGDDTEATVDIGDSHTLKGTRGVDIKAITEDRLLSVIASVSAALSSQEKTAFAGAIDFLRSATKANVTLGKGGKDHGIFAENGSVNIKADGKTEAVNFTVSAAGSRGTAIGFSANINWFNRETKIKVNGGDGYEIKAGKDAAVSADGYDLTVLGALALAGSTKGSTFSGNAAFIKNSNTVESIVNAAKITAGGEAAFASHIKDSTYALGGSIGMANGGSAVGGTVLGVYKSNSVTTDLGTSVVLARGSSGTLAKNIAGSPSFKGVYIGATQDDTTIMGAAGVVLAKNTGVGVNLNIFRDESKIKAFSQNAKITAETGEIKQEARNDTLNWLIAGGINVGKEAGAGASVVGIYSYKEVESLGGQMKAKTDASVTAHNHDDISMLALSAGGSEAIAVQIGLAVQILSSKVFARAYKDVEAEKGSATIKAENQTDLINAAAAAGGSSLIAASPVVVFTWFTGHTEAAALAGVKAARDINIKATADKNIDQYTLGVAIAKGSGLGISGGVTFMYSKDSVLAYSEENSALNSSGGNINVNADGSFKSKAIAGVVAGSGSVSVAINAVVGIMKSKVEAEIGGKASAKNVGVNAKAARDIIDVAATISGSGQAAVGATLMGLFCGDQKMSQDAVDTLTYGNADKKTADNKVLDAGTVLAKGNEMGLDTNGIDLEEDLQGSGTYDSKISVSNPGESSDKDAIKNSVNDPTEKKSGGSSDAAKVGARQDTDGQDLVLARITDKADITVTGDVNVKAAQPTQADLYGATVSISGGAGLGASIGYADMHSNVLAVSQGTIRSAGGKVNVTASSTATSVDVTKDADEQTRMNAIKKNVGEGAFEKLDPTKRSIRAIGLGVFGGTVGLGAVVAAVRTDNVTNATLGGRITEAGQINVHSESMYDNVLAASLSVGAGSAAFNASVAVAASDGDVTARINDTADILNQEKELSVNVTTDTVMNVSTMAAGAAGGAGALNAGVAYAKNNLKQTTAINRGASIVGIDTGDKYTAPEGTKDREKKQAELDKTRPAVNVAATSATTANTTLLVVAGGIGVMNLSGGVGVVKPTINTTIGVEGKGTTTIDLKGTPVRVTNLVTSSSKPWSFSLGAGLLSFGGSGLFSENESRATAKVANSNITSESLTVSSGLKAKGDSTLETVSLGGLSVGFSNNRVDLNATNTAAIDTTNSAITTRKNVRIDTGNEQTSLTEAIAKGASTSNALLSFGGNVADALNRTTNIASLTGNGKLTAGGGIQVEAFGVAKGTTEMEEIDSALISVKPGGSFAPVAKVVNEAVNKAVVNLGSALTSDLDVKSFLDGKTYAKIVTGGATVIEVKGSKADAQGKTSSLVDVNLVKTGSDKVSINVDNYGKDEVTSLVEKGGGGLIAVMLLKSFADSTDVYRTNVNFGDGRFRLNNLDIKTRYDVSVNTSLTPASGGVNVNLVTGMNNDAKSTNRSYAGTFVNIDKGTVQALNDINVITSGNVEAIAEGKTIEVDISAISAGPTDAVADMSAVQATTIDLKGGTLKSTGGNLTVASRVDKALANSVVGAMGLNADDNKRQFDESLISAKPFTSISTERMKSTVSVKGSSPYMDSISAKNIHIMSGTTDEGLTKAKAKSAANVNKSLSTFGALQAEAVTAEKIYTTVEGVEITAGSGEVEILSKGNTESDSSSTAPGVDTKFDFQSVTISSTVGKKDDRQTVQTAVGDLTVINGKTVTIKADNGGYSHAVLDKDIEFVLTEIPNSKSTVESYYKTGVLIGKQANITAKDKIDILSNSKPRLVSNMNNDEKATAVNVSDMHGAVYVEETNDLSIGDSAVLEAKNDLNIHSKSSADTLAKTVVDGRHKILGGSQEVLANTDIRRTLELVIGRRASITSSAGNVNIGSISGEEDNIETESRIDGSGTYFLGNRARSNTSLYSNNTVLVGERAAINASKNVNIQAVATSRNIPDKEAGTITTGIHSSTEITGAGFISTPMGITNIKLDLYSNVFINRGLSSGKTTIESDRGDINLYAGNEGMTIGAYATGRSLSFAGVVSASTALSGRVANTVWVDNSDLAAAGNINFVASPGEKNRTKITQSAVNSGLAQFGSGNAYNNLGGTWTNQLSSYDTGKVGITARGFIHEVYRPDDRIEKTFTASAGAAALTSNEKSDTSWIQAWECDWCTPQKGQRAVIEYTDVFTGKDKELKAAFSKALDAVNEIQKMADNVEESTGITKARYGEEDDKTAGEIFVLALQTILSKDVRLVFEDIRDYLLWNNSDTQQDIFMLPNAARVSAGPNRKLQMVTDVIKGDAFGNGREYVVDVITALTKNAFDDAVISIGRNGSMSMRDGVLSIPSLSDMELYLDEVSGEWLLGKIKEKFIRVLSADQEKINLCALTGAELPEGEIQEGLAEKEEIGELLEAKDLENLLKGSYGEDLFEDLEFFWVGKSPEDVEDPDETLYFLVRNVKTDEVDAFRTSINMLKDGIDFVDVSLYLYRDSKADRIQGEEKYDAMLFDTPDGQDRSIVKAVTNVLGLRTLEVPKTLRIVLREYDLGADLPVRSVSGHLFAMNDGTDGEVSMFDGFYKASFDGDVFESDYLRVEGIADDEPVFTIKSGQPVWPEWDTSTSASDIEDKKFKLSGEEWSEVSGAEAAAESTAEAAEEKTEDESAESAA